MNEYKIITYKGITEDYFKGLSLQEGENAPKLSKQVKKQLGYEPTQMELQAFAELKSIFEDMLEDFGRKLIYLENNLDFPLECEMDKWAFNSSCNNTGSNYGCNTTKVLAEIPNMYHLKLYVLEEEELYPFMRTVFAKKDNHVGHAGSYIKKYLCKRQEENNFYTTAYLASSLLLNYIFCESSHKMDAFTDDNGLYLDGNENCGVWANIGHTTSYTKLSTQEDFLYDLGEYSVVDIMGYVYCAKFDEYVPREDAVWSEYEEVWIDTTREDCVYSGTLDMYFSSDEVLLEYLEVE